MTGIPRKIRLLLLIASSCAVLLVLALLVLYLAARHEPTFYREAMEIEPAALEAGSNRMLQQTTALASAVKKKDAWEALFTSEQINGWLAVDMVKNHPNVLPPMLHDPRVAIDPTGITIACRFEQDSIDTVLSLTVEPYASGPDVIALRIVKARVGLLPAPLGKVLDQLTKAALDMKFRIEWRRTGNDPVAMLSFPPTDDDRPMRIETLRLGEGEIYMAGSAPEEKP